MKTTLKVYIIGATICRILCMAIRVAALPIALAYDALDAMAATFDKTADRITEGKI